MARLFAASTSLDLEAFRLLDRTGECGRCQGPLSQHEKVTDRAFDRQIGLTKREDGYADCRTRTGWTLDRHSCYATGDREWSFEDSRIVSYTDFG